MPYDLATKIAFKQAARELYQKGLDKAGVILELKRRFPEIGKSTRQKWRHQVEIRLSKSDSILQREQGINRGLALHRLNLMLACAMEDKDWETARKINKEIVELQGLKPPASKPKAKPKVSNTTNYLVVNSPKGLESKSTEELLKCVGEQNEPIHRIVYSSPTEGAEKPNRGVGPEAEDREDQDSGG